MNLCEGRSCPNYELCYGIFLKEKTTIARMPEFDLNLFSPSLVRIIIENFGVRSGNEDLLESCRLLYGQHETDENGPTVVIIRALWKKLQNTHILRAVK